MHAYIITMSYGATEAVQIVRVIAASNLAAEIAAAAHYPILYRTASAITVEELS